MQGINPTSNPLTQAVPEIPATGRALRSLARGILGLRYHIDVQGANKVPQGGAVYISNHPGELETALTSYLPFRPQTVATGDFAGRSDFKSRVMKGVIRASGSILVGRGNVTDICADYLRAGKYIWLAPMGRRHPGEPITMREGGYQPPPLGQQGPSKIHDGTVPREARAYTFNYGISSGAITMALKSGKPLIPVFFAGIRAATAAAKTLQSSSVGIIIGDPIAIDPEDCALVNQSETIPQEIILKYKSLIVLSMASLGDHDKDDLPYSPVR